MPNTSIVTVGLLFVLSAASATAGPCTDEIVRLTKEMSARDAAMSKETEGRAASPQDMQRQAVGQPPAAQQTQPSGPDVADRKAAAMEAFNRALMFDQQGNESGCLSAIEEIRRLSSE